jgi:hypothetical protein
MLVDRRVHKVQRAIRRDPCSAVSQLAGMVDLSVSRLQHVSKAQLGVTIETHGSWS